MACFAWPFMITNIVEKLEGDSMNNVIVNMVFKHSHAKQVIGEKKNWWQMESNMCSHNHSNVSAYNMVFSIHLMGDEKLMKVVIVLVVVGY